MNLGGLLTARLLNIDLGGLLNSDLGVLNIVKQ